MTATIHFGMGRVTETTHLGIRRVTETSHLGLGRVTETSHLGIGRVTETSHLGIGRVTETSHLGIGRVTETTHLDMSVTETAAAQTPDRHHPHRQQWSPRQRNIHVLLFYTCLFVVQQRKQSYKAVSADI